MAQPDPNPGAASPEIETRTLRIESADGASVDGTLRHGLEAAPGAPVWLISPAMGVRATFYRRLAEALARRGHPSLTADLRGLGTSSVRASRRSDFGYREMVELDFPARLRALGEAFPGRAIHGLGHSLGGQLTCLAVARLAHLDETDIPRPRALTLVASCSIYYRSWPGLSRYGTLGFYQFAKVLGAIFGYFPGHRVGFGDREARRVIDDWYHQGTTGRYRLRGSELDYESLLREVRLPTFALSFTDDPYCPAAATEHLLGKMESPSRLHRVQSPADLGVQKLGHFGWIHHAEAVADRLLDGTAHVTQMGPGPKS